MFKALPPLWNTISNIGVNQLKSPASARNLILTNRLVLVIFFLLSSLFIFDVSTNGWTPFNESLLVGNIGAFVTILGLNRLGFSRLSRIILSWMVSIYPFLTTLKVKMANAGTVEEVMYYQPRLFIMTTAVVPILIFSFREKVPLLISLLGSLIPLVFFDIIHNRLSLGYYQMGFNATMYSTFHAITLTAYSVFIVASIFFKRMNERYELKNLKLIDSLERKNAELTEKNNKIEHQSKELELANHEIRIINTNLEKVVNTRTKKLLDQASQFQMFSYKNSHELRAPLAKVMGVLELMKEAQTQEEIRGYLELLNLSCQELDKIVHDINDVLHGTSLKSDSGDKNDSD